MSDKSMNKVFLMALSEPEYARLDFWISEQKDSKYSKNVFLRKLMDAYQHYEYQIDKRLAEFKALNPESREPDFKLPLVYETDHEFTGRFGKTELDSLLLSIQDLLNKWDPDNDKPKPQVKNIQPIHWLEGEEPLRLFIEELKSAGLIEERETEDIIQEHFFVDGQAPTKEPKPIAWKVTKVLLAHLINGLEKSVENKNIWKDLAPHFEWKGKTPDGLRQSYNDNPHPNNIEKIESIIKQLNDSE